MQVLLFTISNYFSSESLYTLYNAQVNSRRVQDRFTNAFDQSIKKHFNLTNYQNPFPTIEAQSHQHIVIPLALSVIIAMVPFFIVFVNHQAFYHPFHMSPPSLVILILSYFPKLYYQSPQSCL